MRAICAQAGVTPPTLYHHYGDLRGLHQAAIDETYLQVVKAYQEGATNQGPLKGIRDGWARFLSFAYAEPNMCRIVIEQIMVGAPPRMVAETLRGVAEDLEQFYSQGLLKYSPYESTQLLWMSALGALTYVVSRQDCDDVSGIVLQRVMLDSTLHALFKSNE